MKKKAQAFVNQLLVCLLVTMTFGGTIGLGMVWMRHQISVTAKANRVLDAAIGEINQRSDDIEAVIRSEQRPELLRRLNLEMRLGLVPMNEVRVTLVTDNVTQTSYGMTETYSVSGNILTQNYKRTGEVVKHKVRLYQTKYDKDPWKSRMGFLPVANPDGGTIVLTKSN